MASSVDSLGIGVSNVDHDRRFLAGCETVDKRCHEERSRNDNISKTICIEVHNEALSSVSR